jgi:Flp pilus assembly protein TadD
LGADPDDPEVLGWLGACVVQLGGDAKSAAAMIERALQRHPGSAVLHLVRGWLLACRGGSPDLAIQHAEVAQRLDPRSPHIGTVLATLGLSYFELARFDEAISAFAEYGQRQFAVWPVLTLTMAAAQAHMGRLAAAGATLRPLPKAVVEGALAQVRPGRFRDQLLAGLVLAEGPESG